MSLLLGIVATLAIIAAVMIVLALTIRAMVRDRKHGTSGSLSTAMLEVQSLLEPGKRKIVQTMQKSREDKEDDLSHEP